ncbi:MAG: phosphohydrolase [Pseudomonadota bacterium]
MTDTIAIIDHSDRVESLFEPYRNKIGDDFPAYRGHVYRVITYAMHFLEGDEDARPIVETALVYHDIGLWTEKELAYLEPSEQLALADNQKHGWGLDPQLLRDAIHWHHKIFPYHGPNQRIIEAVRKGDWIDATNGMIRKGLTKAQVTSVQDAIPNYDFGNVLQKLAGDLGGNKINGNFRVLRHVFKW